MPLPKKHLLRVTKFVEIVVGRAVTGEIDRGFHKKGVLDSNYTISLFATNLLPMYNDDRIEISGSINNKSIDNFFISGDDLTRGKTDPNLVKEVVRSFMKLRIKEIK